MKQSTRIEKICPTCGKCFMVGRSEQHRRKFCSFACKGIGQVEYQTRPLEERFWEKVGDRSDPNACWLWTGARTNSSKGYGHIGVGRKKLLQANRVSYEIHYGPIPEGMYVLHKCDVKACVNPNHLELGDNSKNIRDSYDRSDRVGFKSIVPDETVAAIFADDGRHIDIAKRYGVSMSYVGLIKTGKRRRRAINAFGVQSEPHLS